MSSYGRLYVPDVAVIKDYGGVMTKLTLHKILRQKGFEVVQEKRQRGTANEEKLQCNISRTKQKIFELAYCNDWEYFVTLTIDKKRYDRNNLKKYNKDLNYFIRNYNKKHGLHIKRLMIPEKHKDGTWHMHGFIMGLPREHLFINENGYLDWYAYKRKFGFISMDKIRSKVKISKYITKYISKDLGDCVKELNAKMYYCSKGLERAKEIKRGIMLGDTIPQFDYEGDWVKVKTYDNTVPLADIIKLIN